MVDITLPIAFNWAKSTQPISFQYGHHAKAIRELWPIIKKVSPKVVLECGTGEPPSALQGMLIRKHIKTIGMDFISDADVQADMHEMPFEDGSFDLAIARHSIEHCIAPYLALSEMKRVAGHLLVIVPCDSEKFRHWEGHLSIFPREIWEMMFWRLSLRIMYFGVGDFSEPKSPDADIEWRYLLTEDKTVVTYFMPDGRYTGKPITLAKEGWQN